MDACKAVDSDTAQDESHDESPVYHLPQHKPYFLAFLCFSAAVLLARLVVMGIL